MERGLDFSSPSMAHIDFFTPFALIFLPSGIKSPRVNSSKETLPGITGTKESGTSKEKHKGKQ
jgi:hypothetical protein